MVCVSYPITVLGHGARLIERKSKGATATAGPSLREKARLPGEGGKESAGLRGGAERTCGRNSAGRPRGRILRGSRGGRKTPGTVAPGLKPQTWGSVQHSFHQTRNSGRFLFFKYCVNAVLIRVENLSFTGHQFPLF